MKTLIALLLCCSAHADSLICDAHDGGFAPFQIEIDPTIPTLFEVAGTNRQPLITETTLLGANKSECQIRQNQSPYQFTFTCHGYRRGGANNDTNGDLKVDAGQNNGSFEETVPLAWPRHISFENCKPKT